ncbi:MAG: Aldehyde dehydrogenase, partial [uncultured Nocardioides sp.]
EPSRRTTDRPQDLQALHRRGLPTLGVGPLLQGGRREGRLRGQRGHGLAQGRPRRRQRRAQGLRRLVLPHGLQPGPDPLSRRGDDGGPPPAVRRGGQAVGGPREPPGRQGGRRVDRPPGLVRRLGRQDHPGHRQRQPGRRPLLQPLQPRADRRRGRGGPAGLLAARAGQRHRAGRGDRQHRRGPRLARAPAARGDLRGGAGDLRRPRRCREHPHRSDDGHRSVAGLAHGRQRPRPDRRDRARRGGDGLGGGGGRQPQAGAATAGRRARLVRRARPRPDDDLPGDQDRLAPDRHL